MSYATRVSYVAAAGQRDFDVTFPYLDVAHVEVSVNSALTPVSAFEWVGENRIRFKADLAANSVVTLRRRTPLDRALVQFRNGSVLAEEELNRANLQLLYVQQELADLYQYGLDRAQVRLGDNLSVITTPDKIMDELAALVLADELLADLNTRLQDYEQIAAQVISEALRGVELKRGVNVIRDRVRTVEDSTGVLAAVLDLLAIVASDGQSMVLREDKVFRGNGQSYAQAFTQIETNFGDQSASITSLGQTVTTNNSAFATLRDTLGAYAPGGGAFILNESTVKRANGQSFAETFSGITARLDSADDDIAAVEAGVIEVNQAVVAEGVARATSIDGVIARVEDAEASVTVVSEAQVSLEGTVGGLQNSYSTLSGQTSSMMARYGVALNVNGHITGFIQNNNGTTGDFNIVADKFRIVSPNGGTPITVFQTDGAYASFANPVTVTAGSYKLVMGPAFGAQGNLILWYGPSSISVPSCSTSNAIFALTISGQTVIPSSGGSQFSVAVSPVALSASTNTWPATIQTGSVTVTPVGNTGTVTYDWACSNRNINIVAPSNRTTSFTATLNGSTSVHEGVAICTATDSGSGRQVQATITLLFSTNA